MSLDGGRKPEYSETREAQEEHANSTQKIYFLTGGSSSKSFLLLGNIAIQWTTVPSILPFHITIIIKHKMFLSLKNSELRMLKYFIVTTRGK